MSRRNALYLFEEIAPEPVISYQTAPIKSVPTATILSPLPFSPSNLPFTLHTLTPGVPLSSLTSACTAEGFKT